MKGPWNGAEWIVNIDPSCEQWSPPFTLGLWSLVTKGQKKNAWSQLIPEQCPGDLPLRSPPDPGSCLFRLLLLHVSPWEPHPDLSIISLLPAVSQTWVLVFIFSRLSPKEFDAFELWCWTRLSRVPRTARSPNQSILKEISPGYSLEGLMLKVKLQYLGYLIQRADSLEKTLMLRKIEGKRRRRW